MIVRRLAFDMSGDKSENKRKTKGLTWAEASKIVSWSEEVVRCLCALPVILHRY